ncbi:MAG: hypothetical protein R2856_07215 [Caldilineaceae bacterium]
MEQFRRQFPDFSQGQMPDVDLALLPACDGGDPFLLCAALIIGIALWAVGTIARGGLVASVNDIENGVASSFRRRGRRAWGVYAACWASA